MRKTHLILLVITAVMALFSAYSLAAINQVYNIDFEWYSQFNKRFVYSERDTSLDKWSMPGYPEKMFIDVIRDLNDFQDIEEKSSTKPNSLFRSVVKSNDFSKYALLYCSLGETHSPEYRIKVIDIAQRGNVVEVRLSLNNPNGEVKKKDEEKIGPPEEKNVNLSYHPEDIIRIDKDSFTSTGGLYFIFKTQSGKHIVEKYYEIR